MHVLLLARGFVLYKKMFLSQHTGNIIDITTKNNLPDRSEFPIIWHLYESLPTTITANLCLEFPLTHIKPIYKVTDIGVRDF